MWRVLRDFEFMPRRGVIMVFRAGEVRQGLTRACIAVAGDRVEEIRSR
jgi:hypothetical protein